MSQMGETIQTEGSEGSEEPVAVFGSAYKGTSLANCSRTVDVRSNGATAAGLSVSWTGSEKVTPNVVEGGLNAAVPTPKKGFRCS